MDALKKCWGLRHDLDVMNIFLDFLVAVEASGLGARDRDGVKDPELKEAGVG